MADISNNGTAFPLAEMTTRIVAAYLSRTALEPEQLGRVIGNVAGALRALDKDDDAAGANPSPAVPVDQSVTRNHVVCLLCGEKHKILKRHLKQTHGLSPAEYREKFSLLGNHPLVAPEYTKRRSELAREIGLGVRPRLNGAEG